ncbi:MAG: hypothetical protein RML46_00050 [Anaerolineae bacterium]|nr:hypothetical protein [Anaerolineae bacterium]MDW8067287.1 hypothetical protein [Anaerolineae bacterium]
MIRLHLGSHPQWSLSVRDWERMVEEALAIFLAIVLPLLTRV